MLHAIDIKQVIKSISSAHHRATVYTGWAI